MTLILIRYGEMGLKSRSVRARFESIFKENIKDFFVRGGIECIITSDWGRVYLRTEKADKGIEILKHIFGIVSISTVVESTSDIEEICRKAVEISGLLIKPNQCFAVRARRTGDHKYTSMQVAQRVGAAVLDAYRDRDIRVNLTKPEIEIHIEIRKNRSYIYSDVIQCAGGLPLGTQGKVVALFNGDFEQSAAAAWLMMKRGCRTYIICSRKDGKWLTGLANWDTHLRIHEVSGDIWIAALEIACKISACGVVTAEDVSSPRKRIAKKAGLPVFYPLIGLSDPEIKEIGKRILV